MGVAEPLDVPTRHYEGQTTPTYREPLFGVGVAEPLDVVEDEPCKGDNHEDNEGDGNEEHGSLADVVGVGCLPWRRSVQQRASL